ncbi:MAG: sel1 repeat family protein [Planctomycetes bacterium]|nr:sel1 repeat family protein [Planctomycetota bacterium]
MIRTTRIHVGVLTAVLGVLFSFPVISAPSGEEKPDPKAEFTRMLEAARRGDSEAQNFVGCAYLNGEGVEKDYKEGFYWFRRGAEQGHVKSFYNLGLSYENGFGVPVNLETAFNWYRLSAEQGFDRAQFQCGWFLQEGRGTEKDLKAAFDWYCKAADQGHAQAQKNLGSLYYHGQGTPRDYVEAARWFRRAAEQGDAGSQNNLGVCCYYGRGVQADRAAAVEWYRKAAEQGLAMAQCNLGEIYMNGNEGLVPQDDGQAFFWLEQAAEQGHSNAQYLFGLLYYHGRGVPSDMIRAHVWFSLAAAQGNENARKDLAELTDLLSDEDLAQAQRLTAEWKPGVKEKAIPRPGFEINGLYFRPDPAIRGREGWIGVRYRLNGDPETVHESWYLYFEGTLQFPEGSLDLSFQPKEQDVLREIPFPVPAEVARGRYELRLKATMNEKTVERSLAFSIE